MTDPGLARLRERIAAVDRELLATVNRRIELVRELRARGEEPAAGPEAGELYARILELVEREAGRG